MSVILTDQLIYAYTLLNEMLICYTTRQNRRKRQVLGRHNFHTVMVNICANRVNKSYLGNEAP